MADSIAAVSLDVSYKSDGSGAVRLALQAPDAPSLAASPGFDPGRALEIDAGYGTATAPLFSGRLRSVGLESRSDKDLLLILEATADAAPSEAGQGLTLTYGDTIASLALRRENDATVGEIGFQGSALAIPGATIVVAGLGGRFDGAVTIGTVDHAIKDNIWTTRARVGPSVQTMEFDDLVLHARGSVTIAAGVNLTLSAVNAATLTGLSIAQTAKVSFTAEGQAQATVTSPGLLTLKGALVKIN